jgi:hypothetical protein
VSAGGQPKIVANVFDAAVFFQDDWKFSPRLTLSGGLRWESQNHVSDHSDIAPRISMAWAVDGKGAKQAKTVLRAGYGIFYDRLGIGNFSTIDRSVIEEQYTLGTGDVTPQCFTDSFTAFNLASCGTGTASTRASYQVAPGYRSPYTQQFGASLERQVTKTQTATLTYLHSQGIHQLVEINANAPQFGAKYDANKGPEYQYFPEGVFKQDQLIFNTNVKFSNSFNAFGFYTLSFAHSDGAGGGPASDSTNLSKDYGPAGFVARNQIFLIGNYTARWGIRFNPFLIAQAGRPFNITSGQDWNGDSFFNDRPYVANASECSSGAAGFYATSYGCLDANKTPLSGEKLLGNNAGKGPAAVALNLRISRSFGIGPKIVTDPNANNQGGPPPGGGGPPGGGRGGPGGGGPGGGFGPGGFGGGGRGGPGGMNGPVSNRKYNLSFSAQALNIFNDIDRGTPIGTLGNPNFGTSPSLQGGIFSQGSAARRVFLQATFSF